MAPIASDFFRSLVYLYLLYILLWLGGQFRSSRMDDPPSFGEVQDSGIHCAGWVMQDGFLVAKF